jgi:hypothetical protein
MLEALTRIHKKSFGNVLFDKWNKRFKKLEDLFGEMDEYIALEQELSRNKKVTNEVLKYFNVRATNYVNKCEQRLHEKDWFNNKLESFDSKLSLLKIEFDNIYITKINQTLENEVEAILNFALKYNYQFTKLEEQVHELRRKLRWLSIYAQAFQGLIQLKKTTKATKFQLNYFTKETLNSPYNQLPPKTKNKYIMEYDSDSFFALSWLIKELGKLKDNGFKIEKLADAIFISEEITRIQAKEKAISILGFRKTEEQDIFKQASELAKIALVNDKILGKLIIA